MKFLLIICLLFGLASGCGDGDISSPHLEPDSVDSEVGPSTDTIGFDTQGEPAAQPPPFYLGGERPATYYMPYDYDGATPVPMIIALHGYGEHPSEYDAILASVS